MVIPFFGLLMKDLFLLYNQCKKPLHLDRPVNENGSGSGNTTTTAGGVLSWVSLSDFAQHMADLQRWKRVQCPFRKSSPVLQYLLLGANYSERSEWAGWLGWAGVGWERVVIV